MALPPLFRRGRWLLSEQAAQEGPPLPARGRRWYRAVPLDDAGSPSRLALRLPVLPRGGPWVSSVPHPSVAGQVDEVVGGGPDRLLVYSASRGFDLEQLLTAGRRAHGRLPHAIVATTVRALCDAAATAGERLDRWNPERISIDVDGRLTLWLSPPPPAGFQLRAHVQRWLDVAETDAWPFQPPSNLRSPSAWLEVLARWPEPTLAATELAPFVAALLPAQVEAELSLREQLGMLGQSDLEKLAPELS